MEDKNDVYCCYPCKAKIIENETLPECGGWKVTPNGINGPLVAKIPVVLAEKKIQIDVESKLKLEDKVYEIKRIKKNLFITQCELLPRAGEKDGCVLKSGKLFLGGFVRKNIEYATIKCIGEDGNVVCGDIKYCDFDVEFKCVSEIEYDVPPVVFTTSDQKEIIMNTNCKCNCSCGKCGGNVIEKNPCEQQFEHIIRFVEKPYCEIESAEIFEVDIHEDHKPGECGSCDFGTGCDHKPSVSSFNKIIEKMVINITLKILQDQQVNIPGKCCHKNC